MRLLLAYSVLCVILHLSNGKLARFDNYKVYSVEVNTPEHLEQLNQLEHDGEYHIWNSIKLGSKADIMVPPHKQPDFSEFIDKFNLNSIMKINNVQKYYKLKFTFKKSIFLI